MNKKIKVIELLNKKANNERIPSKIRLEGLNYQYKGSSYYDRYGDLLWENCDLLCVLDSEVEILEDEEDNDISSLNAYKLMEAPYMAKCLDKNSHEEFMENLKQSEVEIVHKIEELIEKVNKLDKKINKEE